MSHIPLPPSHRKILRNFFTYINQFPTQTSTLTTLAGTSPSLRLGEELLMHYKNRVQNTVAAVSTHQTPLKTPVATHKPSATHQLNLPVPSITALHERIATCTQCRLHTYRKNSLQLNTHSKLPIFILLDIVNWSDQLHGKLFTTPDGELLLKILKALGIEASEVYFTTAVKCSSTEEISNQLKNFVVCLQHFHAELEFLKPSLIIAFGEDTYKLLTHLHNFASDRGQTLRYKNSDIVYTHHPKELVNDPTLKKETWDHLKVLVNRIATLKQVSTTAPQT